MKHIHTYAVDNEGRGPPAETSQFPRRFEAAAGNVGGSGAVVFPHPFGVMGGINPYQDPYQMTYGHSRVVTREHGAQDMDQLKRMILEAQPGEVGAVLRRAQFTPRHNAFTSILQVVGKSRQADKAVEVFEEMRGTAKIMPNTFSYSALISALARVGRWEDAARYFDEMKIVSEEDENVKPNIVTYAAMISGRSLLLFCCCSIAVLLLCCSVVLFLLNLSWYFGPLIL